MQTFLSADLEDMSVLLLDPDDKKQSRIYKLLVEQKMNIFPVSSAEDALKILEIKREKNTIQCVICRALRRGMSAGQFVRRMKLDSVLHSIPVLMLTEDISLGIELDGFESGADAYLSYSAHPDLLFLRIRSLLQLSSEDKQAVHTESMRRARIVIVRPPQDETLLDFWNHPELENVVSSYLEEPGLGELLWRDGCTVTSVTRSSELIEGGWLTGRDAPDCLVLEDIGVGEDDLAFCRSLGIRRQTLREQGITPFRTLGVVNAHRFRGEPFGSFLEAGIDDLVPSDMAASVLALRIRTMARRKRQEESLRWQELERQKSVMALEKAKAQSELAEALAQTNDRLVQAQAELVQTARLASLGELVAGIAHEINNPLAFTIGHADTVGRCLEKLDSQYDGTAEQRALIQKAMSRLEAMKKGLHRIQDLVVRLRRFSRLDVGDFENVDVDEAIETILALLAHRFGSGIQVIWKPETVGRVIVCQAALFHQAVMNIVSNAADALAAVDEVSNGYRIGILEIKTCFEEDIYTIAVSDNGAGLPSHISERIFDPFFTTKKEGEGTGLGLSIAHSVVEAHGGSIQVSQSSIVEDDVQETGTCFTIRIPVEEYEHRLAVKGRA